MYVYLYPPSKGLKSQLFFSCGGGTPHIQTRPYICKIIVEFGLTDCNTVPTPSSKGGDMDDTSASATTPVDMTLYRKFVGSLMYAAVGTRPDIAFAVGYLGCFTTALQEKHLRMAKRVLHYLAGTVDLCIVYTKPTDSFVVEGWVDADWGECKVTRRSTTGWIFLANGAPISWCSKRQPTIALSTTEGEYMAITQATKEAVWVTRLFSEMENPLSAMVLYEDERATTLYEDNNGAIALANNPIHHARIKHIDIQWHFVREKVASYEIIIKRVASKEQVANILTKPIAKEEFVPMRNKLLHFKV